MSKYYQLPGQHMHKFENQKLLVSTHVDKKVDRSSTFQPVDESIISTNIIKKQ